MSSRYVIDSYAWIEYFRGSKAGGASREYIESGGAMTPTIVLAELSDKYRREKIDSLDEDLFFIKSKSQILSLDEETAILAGGLNSSMKKEVNGWGMADSIILATTRKHKAKVVTGDEHFRKQTEAVMIE
ncbi:MAG: type II toxin-antitoxin system VapC family toxin [Candidatus Altiarchaeota archaeon]